MGLIVHAHDFFHLALDTGSSLSLLYRIINHPFGVKMLGYNKVRAGIQNSLFA